MQVRKRKPATGELSMNEEFSVSPEEKSTFCGGFLHQHQNGYGGHQHQTDDKYGNNINANAERGYRKAIELLLKTMMVLQLHFGFVCLAFQLSLMGDQSLVFFYKQFAFFRGYAVTAF